MSTFRQFRLPDLGEGLTEGEILKWLVAPGDTVTLNQPIVEVETAKAAVEVPSPYAGVVTEVHHAEGETVDVGAPIITFDTDPSGGAPDSPGGLDPGTAQRAAAAQSAGAAANPVESATSALTNALATTSAEQIPAALVEHPPDDAAVEPGLIGGPAPGGRTSVLVGYGPKTTSAVRRPRRSTAQPAVSGPPQPMRISGSAVGRSAQVAAGAIAVRAKPPVRLLARNLGVDLATVIGTGRGGTIGREDVERAAALLTTAGVSGSGHARQNEGRVADTGSRASEDEPGPTILARPDRVEPGHPAPVAAQAATGREQRIPIKGVRKAMAAAMVTSAFTAPHVTEWVQVDVTRTLKLVRTLRKRPEFGSVRVGPLLLVAKALLMSVRRHPEVNAFWDDGAQVIVVKNYVNLGIAAATPRGLMVPNVKDADRLPLPELARALADLTATAKIGRSSPADLSGGTITITNVGVFGVDTGTPILNPGESAILAFGAIREMPWVHRGRVRPRMVTNLGLSFDHRVIDGQLGSEFLADVGRILADPLRTLAAWG